MQTIIVALTTASCSGMTFLTHATDVQAAALRLAVADYNQEARWRGRGCDGSADLFTSVTALIAWHNKDRDDADDPDGRVSSWDEYVSWLEEDGEAYEADAADTLMYLNDLDRQQDNDLPQRI